MAKFNKEMPILVLSLIFILFSYAGCGEEYDNTKDNKTLTQEQILKIANKEAKTFDISVKESEIFYNVDRTEWQENLDFMNKADPNWPKEYEILNDRDYVIVKYSPKGVNVLGGVLWLFIDRKTGEVITHSLEL